MIQYIRKVLYVLSGKKTQLIWLLLLLIFTSFLEVIGIGLIGPFINIASDPEIIENTSSIKYLYELSGVESEAQFIPLLGLIISIIFLAKSAVYFFARSYIFHFSYQQKELLVLKLLRAYLSVPYTFHLKRNTASLIKNIIIEVNQFAQNSLLQTLNAASSLIIIVSLLALLAKTSSILLILLLAALSPTVLFLKLFGKRFERWGRTRSQTNQEMIRILNHGLGSVKETRLIGCEPYFDSQMAAQGNLFARSSTLFSSSQLLPRIIVESLLVILIVGFVSLYSVFSQQGVEDLTAVLGVFAISALRLIPATNELVKSISFAQNASYTLDLLYNDLRELDKEEVGSFLEVSDVLSASKGHSADKQSKLSFNQTISLSNIRYAYPGAAEDSIQDISLTIRKGQSIALIGKSGAGKTTLVDILLGLLIPTHGDIQVDGQSIYSGLRAWQKLVGYIPQSIFLIDDTIERNIAFGVPDHLIDHRKIEESIQAAQLQELITDLPNGIQTGVGERGIRLSGGQRQRIGIARALYHEREILVLDEATSALDNETERQISQAINALSGSKTLIIIAHRLSTVRECDQLYMLNKGEIVNSGSYQDVVSVAQ